MLFAQYAKVSAKILKGEDWKPVMPTAITGSGNEIMIKMHVPVPPLKVTDHLNKPLRDGYGFSYHDDAGNNKIVRVDVMDTAVKLTLQNKIGANPHVGYAYKAEIANGVCVNNSTGGNIADSDQTNLQLNTSEMPKNFDFKNLANNYLVHFYEPVIVK